MRSYINLFWQLFKTDLIIFKKEFKDNLTNGLIWVGVSTIVFAYVFPKLGMPKDYGPFMLVGGIASWSLFESFTLACKFLADFEGNKTISYHLTLPIPSWMIFVKSAIAHACNMMLITILMIPLGKLILWKLFDLSNFSAIKFVLIFICINLLTSFFGLTLSFLMSSLAYSENVWLRGIFPLWYLGCAQFPWQAMHKFNPTLGKISLINPFLHSIEGIRSSVLGQSGYLPFWICLTMVVIYTILFGFIGIQLLKKRLDIV